MPSTRRRESHGETTGNNSVSGGNLVGRGRTGPHPPPRDQNFDNREGTNSSAPITFLSSSSGNKLQQRSSSISSLNNPTVGTSSASLGCYRPVPSRAAHHPAAISAGTLTSLESGPALTMTSLEWVRCGSGGNKVCIFLVLGIILLMLGIFIGAFYLNIQQLTSSSTLTEVLPNYVIALSVMLIGFSVIILFWKRSRVLLFIAMVLCVCGFLLCILTTILTGTHILKPIVSITYCEYRAASRVCLCYSPYKRSHLTMNYSEKKLFTLPFYGSSNCEIKSLLPRMLYVLCGINLIAAFTCAISYVITLRVYRMKKNKEDELEDEMYDHEGLHHHITRDDSYLSRSCHESHYSGIPPSPESPVPLLEAVSSRGISLVDKTSILRDLLPDLGKKRHVKRSQSFSYHGRSVEGTCDSLDESDGKMLDRTHPRHHTKGRNVPCRTLSETVRPSSAGTPDNSKRKFSMQEGQKCGPNEDNLDNRQLLLILGLHMRNIQEQHEAEIQSIQQENMRRSKTPQPYYPVGKEGYMVGRRAYTPQPAKSQFHTPKPNESYPQVQLPRRRQLFADHEVPKSGKMAKNFAEAMMNDMAYPGREKLGPREQIEMEPLPFCTLDGVPDVEVAKKMNKLKQSDTFYIPKPSTHHPNSMNATTMDPKKVYALSRTMSTSVPSKNDAVFVVPLYEKIDTPEHDMLQSSIHERMIPVSEGQQIVAHDAIPERILRRTPSPFGVKPTSSENLYSKATKSADPLYGRISRKSDRSSPAKLDQMHNYKYVCHTPPKKDTGYSPNVPEMVQKSRHYVRSPDEHLDFSPQRFHYAVKEPPHGKSSTYYVSPQPDMLDLSVTPESLTSDFSPGDDKQERGNISGTSTEFSPPGNNPNRSNASGTSVGHSPSAFHEVKKLCDTPIAHPKMLPSSPNDSSTSREALSPYGRGMNHSGQSLGNSIVHSPEGHYSYGKPDYSRNVTGESADFSPIETHPEYLSHSRNYSPSRHIVETDKPSSSSPLHPNEKSIRGNISGASAKMSPCRNVPHPPVSQMLTPKMAPGVKEAVMNSRTASEPPKRNAKHSKREEYPSSVRGRSASLSPHRNIVDDSLGPREQPYGQYGPYNRKIEGCNVYMPSSKKDQDSNIQMYREQKWNHDVESQPRKEKPPPPYPSRSSHNGSSSKSHGESRKNVPRGRGNFRVGPEGISYRRKKIEKLDMSFDQVDDLPRSEMDVEGDVDREDFYPTPEQKRILTDYEYRKHLEDQQNFLLLRDKGSGSDSDALETVI